MQVEVHPLAQAPQEHDQSESLLCMTLPEELILKIFQKLDIKGLAGPVCLTCRKLKRIAEDNNLWAITFAERFGTPSLPEPDISWKSHYASLIEGRRILEYMNHFSRPEQPRDPRKITWHSIGNIRHQRHVTIGEDGVLSPWSCTDKAAEIDLITDLQGRMIGIENAEYSSHVQFLGANGLENYPNIVVGEKTLKVRFELQFRSKKIGTSYWLDPERRDGYILVQENIRFRFLTDEKYWPKDLPLDQIEMIHRIMKIKEAAFNHHIQISIQSTVEHNLKLLSSTEMLDAFECKEHELASSAIVWDQWFFPVSEFQCDEQGRLYSPENAPANANIIGVIGLHSLVENYTLPTWTFSTYEEHLDSIATIPQKMIRSSVLHTTIHRLAEILLGCKITSQDGSTIEQL